MTAATSIGNLAMLLTQALDKGQSPALRAVLGHLERSQWASPEELLHAQFQQLTTLCNHAAGMVPFHARRLAAAGFRPGEAMSPEIWRRLPLLNRSEIRDLGEDLKASSYPESFGRILMASSGGSTGIPVRVLKNEVEGLIWQAAHLREALWNGILDGEEMANLRGVSKDYHLQAEQNPLAVKDGEGIVLPDWGAPVTFLRKTGVMGILQPDQSLTIQADFLRKRRPENLLMRPAGLRLLLSHFREKGLRLDSLRRVWTISESVDDALREECQDLFGCPIISNYSANEVGYMGLQCPLGTNYHLLSEFAYIEVLGSDGRPCRPGEIGKVIATPLHNFAMPLLRYEIGDEAEVGEPCVCGRGLPSLKRIVGRTQDYLKLASGVSVRVDISHYRISNIRAVREFQLVQKSLEALELRVVTSRPLEVEERSRLQELVEKPYGRYFTCSVVVVESLPRTVSGKLLQFVSEVNVGTHVTRS
jgi:phenylacetate-CoA ligase